MAARIHKGGGIQLDTDRPAAIASDAGLDIEALAWSHYRKAPVSVPSKERLGAALRIMLEQDGVIGVGHTRLRASVALPSSSSFVERFRVLDEAGRLPDRRGGASGRYQKQARAAASPQAKSLPNGLREGGTGAALSMGRARAKLPTQNSRALRVQQALTRGGLRPEDAARIAEKGLTRADIGRVVTTQLFDPGLAEFPHHVLVVALLAEAQEIGGLTAARVADIVEASRDWVVVRPDGVLAAVASGRPMHSFDTLRVEDGRLVAGALELGRLYHERSGILRTVEAGFETGAIAAELGLAKGFVGHVLDGVEEVVIGGFVGTAELGAALYLDFGGTVERGITALGDAAASLPEEVARAPEHWERLANLPASEQTRMASKLITSLLLLGYGAGQASSAANALSTGGGRLLATVDGAVVQALALDGAAAALGHATAGALATGVGLSGLAPGGTGPDARALNIESRKARDGDASALDARQQHWLEDRGRRAGLVDPEDTTHSLESLGDSNAVAKIMGESHPLTLKWYRAKVTRRLREEVAALDSLPSLRMQDARATKIRAIADDLEIDLHEALQIGGSKVPLSDLSPAAQRIVRDIERGIEPKGVYTREVVEEVATQFTDYVDTTGWPTTRVKTLLRERTHKTLHWDDQFGADGLLIRHGPDNPHAKTPHLQIHRKDDRHRMREFRLFFTQR